MAYRDLDKQKAASKRHYEQHKDEYKARNKTRKQLSRIFFQEYKKNLCCERCGENHPACLEFHHLDPSVKDHNVSEMISRNFSVESILKEIDKCIVLCANCHRKEHYSV